MAAFERVPQCSKNAKVAYQDEEGDFLTRKEKKRMQMRLMIGEMGDTRVARKLASFISGSSNDGGS